MDGNKDILTVVLTVVGVAVFVGVLHFFGDELGIHSASDPNAAVSSDPVDQGRRLARNCIPCHDLTSARRLTRVGPPLWGVVGQRVASVPGYQYSRAQIRAGQEGVVWDEPSLDRYLANPKEFIPGNKMAFSGLREASHRRFLIEFLKTLQDHGDGRMGLGPVK
ncbi:MAG: hypothetical protein HQL81_14145 [Magnetococcales bacterium]|nr:hypothetical protein [Magnetococcales bacterium]MBF0632790.1 hypothetical protein [Magnetococcales bacterium]